MNYLQEAKKNIELIGTVKESENVNALMNVTQALTLIAIAEINEGRLTNEIEMTARLHVMCEQFIKIAEQQVLANEIKTIELYNLGLIGEDRYNNLVEIIKGGKTSETKIT